MRLITDGGRGGGVAVRTPGNSTALVAEEKSSEGDSAKMTEDVRVG